MAMTKWQEKADEILRRAKLDHEQTEAAIHGCHHCNEGADGHPCWWCGRVRDLSGSYAIKALGVAS